MGRLGASFGAWANHYNLGRLSGECFHTRYGCMNAFVEVTLKRCILAKMTVCSRCRDAFMKGDVSSRYINDED